MAYRGTAVLPSLAVWSPLFLLLMLHLIQTHAYLHIGLVHDHELLVLILSKHSLMDRTKFETPIIYLLQSTSPIAQRALLNWVRNGFVSLEYIPQYAAAHL